MLPSARTGILLALRAVAPAVNGVVGPAFTCAVVHQAMQLSGLPVRLVDSEPSGYLMHADDLRKAAEGPSAVVLCEVYGLRYGVEGAALAGNHGPVARIWDMAMCVPQADDFLRLATGDAAVLSFGLGKCLYAGWGGLLLTQDPALAARVRELRDAFVAKESRGMRLRHGLEVLVRTAAHARLVYGLGRTLADWRNRKRGAGSREQGAGSAEPGRSYSQLPAPCSPLSETRLSPEWTEPMTTLERKLAKTNLAGAADNRSLRHEQAAEYYRRLEPLGVIRGFDGESLPESHFPIRVASTARNDLRRYLAGHGIDTATYFPFPGGLTRATIRMPHGQRMRSFCCLSAAVFARMKSRLWPSTSCKG